MKKRIVIVFAAAFAIALAACGGSKGASSNAAAAPQASYEMKASASGGYISDNTYAEPEEAFDADYASAKETAAAAEAGNASGVQSKAYNGEVKLIYRADVSAETRDIDAASASLEDLTSGMGGYVEYSDTGKYGYGDAYSRYANYTVRIPSDKYEAFLAAFSTDGNCSITNISKSTQDIGAEYADTEARLKTLRIKQERLQELLSQAESMEDIISIENALTDIEYEIEWNSSTLNRYDALVDFSTVSVYLQQVARETHAAETDSLGERIASAFRNGISGFATGFENFIVAVAGAVIPLLIIAAVIVAAAVIIVKTAKRRKNGKRKKGGKNTIEDEEEDEE